MATEGSRNPAVRELESLRIARSEAPQPKGRIVPALVTLAALALLALAGYQVYLRTLGRPLEVQTAIVSVRGAGKPGVMLTGSGYIITRHKYIVIGTKILGQIMKEPIEEGQHVKKGDLLAKIDDRDYRAQLKQALADRDLAEANLRLKYSQAKRLRALHAAGVSSQDELDTAENALAVARAMRERADAAVAYAQFNVDQCTILSPINGVVLKKYREQGDTINFGGDIQAGGGTTDIVQLADTSDMRAEVDINESDIARVQLGTPATVVADSHPDRSFDAKLVKIYPAADRQKGTVKVEAKLLHPDLTIIKPEMSTKVTFLAAKPSEQKGDLVIVPKKAVVGEGSNTSVWLVRDGKVHQKPVILGREFQDGFEVKRGLDGGEMVVVVPPANLKEGQAVNPVSS